jgi:hypothetical protein
MPSGVLSVERAVVSLDRARRALLVGLARSAIVGPIVVLRDRRIGAQALAGVTFLVAATLLAPGVLFVVGPALFGVAHLAADVRYLGLRRDLPRRWIRALVAGCVALLMLRGLEGTLPGRWPFAATEVGFGWAWALSGVIAAVVSTPGPAVTVARGSAIYRRALLAGPVILVLMLAALARPGLARIVFAHLHNLVAIGLWLLLFRQSRRFVLPALTLLALAVAFCVSGRAFPYVHLGGPGAARFVDEMIFAWPAFISQRTALGLGLAFVLLQAVHYNVWLTWIPQEDVQGEGTLSFRMSWRSLVKDFPPVWLGLTIFIALAVVAASFADVHRTRQLYLSLSSFHGYFELAAGAFLFVRGK